MDKFERMNALLEQIENLLDSIILSGTGVMREGTVKELNKLQEYCKKTGLHCGEELLEKLEHDLSMKRHNLRGEDNKVVESCCILGAYISAVRSKLRLSIVEENLLIK